MFDEFQTGQVYASCLRRPEIDTLYDVFVNIRDDKGEHVKTMIACQKPNAQKNLKSPNTPDKAGEKLDLPPVSNEEFAEAKQEEPNWLEVSDRSRQKAKNCCRQIQPLKSHIPVEQSFFANLICLIATINL